MTEKVIDYTPYLDPERGLTKEKYQRICNNLTTRATNPTFKIENPTYKNVTMDPEWRERRELICLWICENYYVVPGERMCLDKDILYKGNLMYGPDTCLFVPERINKFFPQVLERSIMIFLGEYIEIIMEAFSQA